MYNFELPQLPERTVKSRETGITMVMDKGLSLRQAEDLINSSDDYIDIVKLGFGTSLVTKDLDKKLSLYHSAGIKTYFGGTLFEAFIVRDMFDQFRGLAHKYKMQCVEVSDGSIQMDHDQKCHYIEVLSKDFTVLSEVGSKEEGIMIRPNLWITMMQKELEAGAWKVIAEARESGTVGIYRPNGNTHVTLVNKILKNVSHENILWEAPNKSQQAWFISMLGANVNLGNIAPDDVISLETLRLGLRGDTFKQFMPENNQQV
ncbi:phosphosulfolactate synthase [Arachidicoccus ginsenosidivorans]|uniref:Phosphosulfolactate synthase n=1 Tax=Arachidicoccus ginsenosidivorans TaxID=496057 RepID=A0A5B8VGG0_9BACT|nr:phosphosulfolactate synthase [Arachidicoccus ginsenosidivorans]QEC70359.1 phosphosulfolactate synthase [Arachidicoccus ginsenosidivorans]